MSDLADNADTVAPRASGRGPDEPRSGLQVLVVVVSVLAGVSIIVAFALLLFGDGSIETTDTSTTADPSTTPTVSPTTGSTSTALPTTASSRARSSTSETPTTSPPATSTSPPTTSRTTTQSTLDPPGVYVGAVWPWPSSTLRYTDPAEAAFGFAVDFVGFTDPVVGEFRQGDSRSGEIDVRSIVDGPVTVVFVRQLGPDDTWWVLGSAAADITVDRPTAMATIESPQVVTGFALGAGGRVDVALRADGVSEPVATTSVAGGAADLEAFSGAIEWVDPGAGGGALVLSTSTGDDGRVAEASVIRVFFAPG